MIENIAFKEGELVAVSLREKNVVRQLFGRCVGRVASCASPTYVVNVFGIGLRAIDVNNPWYPTLTREEGERLEPRTEPYARATVRQIAKPRFVIERDPGKRLFHLVCWSFASGTSTGWEPYENVVTTTIDEFVIHAAGERPPLPFLSSWTVFVAERIESEVNEGKDPFDAFEEVMDKNDHHPDGTGHA